MKTKSVFLVLVPLFMSACYEGEVGPREEYNVTGYVYYPDSTPINKAGVNIIDYCYYSHALSGTVRSEREHFGKTDENGFFSIPVKNGGKIRVELLATYYPKSDTGEVMYHYRAVDARDYTNKHGFEGFQLYTYVKEHHIKYPYLIPSYPIIGDSVRITDTCAITKVSFIENNVATLYSMEYNQGDTSVMFYIPDEASVNKNSSLDIYYENGGYAGCALHLREKKTE